LTKETWFFDRFADCGVEQGAVVQFLMKHMEGKVKEKGAWTDEHTLENVDAMYQVVASVFGPMGTSHNARATQARWSKFLNQIRKKLQKEREAREAEEAEEA
jgi:hypothetical protein